MASTAVASGRCCGTEAETSWNLQIDKFLEHFVQSKNMISLSCPLDFNETGYKFCEF